MVHISQTRYKEKIFTLGCVRMRRHVVCQMFSFCFSALLIAISEQADEQH